MFYHAFHRFGGVLGIPDRVLTGDFVCVRGLCGRFAGDLALGLLF